MGCSRLVLARVDKTGRKCSYIVANQSSDIASTWVAGGFVVAAIIGPVSVAGDDSG